MTDVATHNTGDSDDTEIVREARIRDDERSKMYSELTRHLTYDGDWGRHVEAAFRLREKESAVLWVRDVPVARSSGVADTPAECGDTDDTEGPCRLRPNHLGAHYWEPVEGVADTPNALGIHWRTGWDGSVETCGCPLTTDHHVSAIMTPAPKGVADTVKQGNNDDYAERNKDGALGPQTAPRPPHNRGVA